MDYSLKSCIIFLFRFHVNCKFFYIMIIYEKDWCWCQVVSAVFVLHTIYVVPIGHQHSSGISDWSLYYLPKNWMMCYDIIQASKYCSLWPLVCFVFFLSVNIIWDIFMNVKQRCLKMIFSSSYCDMPSCVAASVFVRDDVNLLEIR